MRTHALASILVTCVMSLVVRARADGDCNTNGLDDSGEINPFGGYALVFDGGNDYVDCGTSSDLGLTNGFTLEAWVRADALSGITRILSKGAPGVSGYGFGQSAGKLRFTTFGIKDYDTANVLLTVGIWTHVAVVLDASNDAHFYVNGQWLETAAGTSPASVSSLAFNLGRNPNATEHWNGAIDEVRVWNVARTSQQIMDHFDTPLAGNEPGLIAYWRLDEGMGTTAADLAGDHDGTLVNGPVWDAGLADCNTNGVPDECDFITEVGVPTDYVVQPNLEFPDNVEITHTISTSSAAAFDDLNVDLVVTHPFIGDTEYWLDKNATTVDLLVSNLTNSTANCDVLLDDEADGPAPVDAPLFGTFQPVQPLSAFDDLGQQFGDWTLHCLDVFTGSGTGVLNQWSLHFTHVELESLDCNTDGQPDECELAEFPRRVFSAPELAIPNFIETNDTITIAEATPFADVNVNFVMSHTFIGDMQFWLDKDGTSVDLMINRGGSFDDADVLLDDEAVDFPPIEGPLFGTFKPVESLSALEGGGDAAGEWTLHCLDIYNTFDTGVLHTWSLHFNPLPAEATDCNSNGVPDICELPPGNELDCNTNDLTDICEPGGEDCNTNSLTDLCEAFADCDGNGTWDDCDVAMLDCNSNGVPDACDVQPQRASYDGSSFPTMDNSDVSDTISITNGGTFSDLNVGLVVDHDAIGGLFFWLAKDESISVFPLFSTDNPGQDCNVLLDDDILAPIPEEGPLVGTFRPSDPLSEFEIDPTIAGDWTLHCFDTADGVEGVVLSWSLHFAVAPPDWSDCNSNQAPDACEIASGSAPDCDTNGVPDVCDPDCNTNDAPDACDVADGASIDCNSNGAPDECDASVADLELLLANLNAGHASITAQVPDLFLFDEGDVGDHISDGGMDMYDTGNILNTEVSEEIPYTNAGLSSVDHFGPDSRYFTAKFPGLFVLAAHDISVETFEITGNNGADGSGAATGQTLSTRVGGRFHTIYLKQVHGANFGDPSINHIIIVPGDGAGVTHSFSDDTDDDLDTLAGLSGVRDLYYLLLARTNGQPLSLQHVFAVAQEFLELLSFAAMDCNTNGTPDECDDPQPDCNTNGQPDGCEQIQDCNTNQVPDECDIDTADPDGNGQVSDDCNTNSVPDDCDTLAVDLSQILANLDGSHAAITALVPDLFLFTGGETGFKIDDGGNDMYDGGNRLNTELDSDIPYTNAAIVAGGPFGPGSSYFTGKYPGLFVMAAHNLAIDTFNTSGDNGADGNGVAIGGTLATGPGGLPYTIFVKRVAYAPFGDPSINHILIVPGDGTGITHTFPTDTNSDLDMLTGLSTVDELYYLLVARSNSEPLSDDDVVAVANAFLTNVAPPSIDCDADDVLDECEAGAQPDCNTNGLNDDCEYGRDCNTNGVLDECDVDPSDPDGNGQVSGDCTTNGLPDECDLLEQVLVPAGSHVSTPNLEIPDLGEVTDTISISSSTTFDDVDVDVLVIDPSAGTEVSLEKDATTVDLIAYFISGSDGNIDVLFDDEALQRPFGDNIVGTFRPVEPLSAFDADGDQAGDWTIHCADNFSGDSTGVLAQWSLHFSRLENVFDDSNTNGIPDECESGAICPTCPGDVNGDSLVDGDDVAGFVTCIVNGVGCACTDTDGDGTTAQADLADDLGAFVEKLLTSPALACP